YAFHQASRYSPPNNTGTPEKYAASLSACPPLVMLSLPQARKLGNAPEMRLSKGVLFDSIPKCVFEWQYIFGILTKCKYFGLFFRAMW
ncbi:MAG: hypothetical protein LBJ10_06825, partial [Clostridiales bacterium]|nr:hypothetical protein [Clostridiales bacterium]